MSNIERAVSLIRALGDQADRVLATLPEFMAAHIREQLETTETPALTPDFYDSLATDVAKITSQESAKIVAEDNAATAIVEKISNESPLIIAFVAKNLDPKQSERVMGLLPVAQRDAIKAHELTDTILHAQVKQVVWDYLAL